MSTSTTQLSPILSEDVGEVGHFLHRHLNPRLSAAEWSRSMLPSWAVDSPNHGVKLTSAGRIVGVYLAFYSRREIEGTVEAFCNLGAWCVLDAHRADSLRMVRFLLSQRGFHFTDLSPSGSVVPLNQRLKFELLDTSTALLPNRPRVRRARFRVVDDLDAIASELDEDQRLILRDHRGAAASHHVLLQGATRSCYVILRRDRRKGLPIFASLLHVSDQQVFAEAAPDLSHHLLLRHGVLFTLAELRVVGTVPSGARLLRSARPKMFRSRTLGADAIDNLYSELTCVAW